MINTTPCPSKSQFVARDGAVLVYHQLGEQAMVTDSQATQPPLILLHGLFSSAEVNWLKYGHAAAIATSGRCVILPDLRAHGESPAPQEARYYPRDILLRDLEDLLVHLRAPTQETPLGDGFDLGGFSLGARIATQAVTSGLQPRRLILAGMGLAGLGDWSTRKAFFARAIDRYATAKRDEDIWLAVQFMKTMRIDPIAARYLLDSLSDIAATALQSLTMPTLIVCGSDDHDNGSAQELAAALPNALYRAIPGTHMSSVTQKQLGTAIRDFLTSSPT